MIVDVKKKASGRDLSGPGCPARNAAGRKDCRRDNTAPAVVHHASAKSLIYTEFNCCANNSISKVLVTTRLSAFI